MFKITLTSVFVSVNQLVGIYHGLLLQLIMVIVVRVKLNYHHYPKLMMIMVKLNYHHYPKLMMIMGIIQAAGEAQIIYPDLSCFLQIGGKYESQLIDLDFPGLEKHFHICAKSTRRSFASRIPPSFLDFDAQFWKLSKSESRIKGETCLKHPARSEC